MQPDTSSSNAPSSAGNPPQHGRKRKAPSASRGVASLTPEQLAKKRANDREAQRAIRERTKQQIESLERRIQELTSQQPYQELQAVTRQKDAIQAENDEIKRRLASIMSIIQPIVGAHGLTELATAAQHNVQAGLAQQNSAFHPTTLPHSDAYLNSQQNGRPFTASPNMPQSHIETTGYSPPLGPEDTVENRTWHPSRDALSHQRDNLQRGMELNDSGERLSFNFLLDSIGQRSGTAPPQTISPSRRPAYPTLARGLSEQSQAPWTVLPKNVPPTCPLDGLLLNFLHSRRREANQESGINPLLNPTYPSVSSLLNPSGSHRLDPVSQLMTDIISRFPNISDLPEQAAVLFAMFMFMRWLINPTQENYERMPEWLRPTPAQLFTPHPVWIDHVPWPRMRDKVLAHYQDYPFENWFIPFTSDLSVNWPYDPVDCLISNSEKDDPLMNPAFERHIRRIENWSVGPAFAEAFPTLVDTTRIKPKDPPL
ncbi:uncharacterized protein Z518_04390 [Rhinocladiella mackenziei CBS 650.93]|uniref:BZIP transcription factor n=1 Tax=Rhinocladiella mackenziei CBS 650.93 TaxID=1442369 RepID=A0A0D2IL35_9EURO|nr:uncharacterized protein Z518_04390 [Rhinocladiella mackenziei CBS 650.93]KIX06414.1 hypothetical protein Z518_04390 [Rhinocladiella mackenziei CBS 650.93]